MALSKTTDDLKDTMGKLSDVIDHAVSTGDYSNMSREISYIVQDTATIGTEMIRDAATKGAGSLKEATRPKVVEATYASQEVYESKLFHPVKRDMTTQREDAYFMPPASTMGPRILSIIGVAGGIIWGFATLGLLLGAVLSGFGSLWMVTGICGAVTGGHLYLSNRMSRRSKLMDRYKVYRNYLSERLYGDLKDMSDTLYLTQEEIRSDLKDLMKLGMFRQGHFDRNETCFIASDDLYRQYQESEKQALLTAQKSRMEEEKRKQAEAERKKMSPEVQAILEQGTGYIERIHRTNDAIPDEILSKKLEKMEHIVRRIFEEVEKEPALAGRLNTFMDYYLPTTGKLLDVYVDLASRNVKGENVKSAMKEIEDSLDTINDAFETLLDSFFRDQALDVSSDINVMKTMLKQDGLTEDELSALRRRTK